MLMLCQRAAVQNCQVDITKSVKRVDGHANHRLTAQLEVKKTEDLMINMKGKPIFMKKKRLKNNPFLDESDIRLSWESKHLTSRMCEGDFFFHRSMEFLRLKRNSGVLNKQGCSVRFERKR